MLSRKRGKMRKSRIAAACISAVMVLSSLGLGGCSSKTDEDVSDDTTTWYSAQKKDASEYYSDLDISYDSKLTYLVGVCGDYIIAWTYMFHNDYDPDAPIQDTEDYFMDLYSVQGDYIKSIHVNDYIDLEDYSVSAEPKVNDEGVDIILDGYDVNTWRSSRFKMTLDLESLELGKPEDLDKNSDPYEYRYVNASHQDVWKVNGYSIHLYYNNGTNRNGRSSYILLIIDPNGEEHVIDLANEFSDISIIDLTSYIAMPDGKILIFANFGELKLVLDPESMTVTEAGDEMDWLDDIFFYGITNIEGEGAFVVDNYDSSQVLAKLNFEERKIETVIDLSNVLINPFDINSMLLVDIHDGEYVMAGTLYNQEFATVTIKELEEDPYEGKTELKAVSLTGYDYGIYESILRFNESNEDYYIKIDHSYDSDHNDINVTTLDEYNDQSNVRQAEMSDQLMVDLMAGAGPDILFNTFSLSALNRGEYLVDLSDRISDDSRYFTNIVDASRTGEALYQMPLTINIKGIFTSDEFADDGQDGFTFEQYVRYVDEACNGDDPMSDYTTQKAYFSELFNSCSDLFINTSGCDFSSEGFREFASYIKDHVNNTDNSLPGDDGVEIVYQGIGGRNAAASLTSGEYKTLDDFSVFINSYAQNFRDVRFLGAPSPDGRGPSFRVETSVAVSSSSSEIEGCCQFVDMLMSDEMITVLAYDTENLESVAHMVSAPRGVMTGDSSIPVNSSVLDEYMQTLIRSYNSDVEYYQNIFTADESRMMGLPTEPVSDDIMDVYREFVSSCDHARFEDPYVAVILSEELQAYYEDQKTIDTVIDTLTNRVNTYLSERG